METPEAHVNIQTPRKIPPHILQAAQSSPVLAHMIEHGLPLNRKTWLEVNYGGDSEIPSPWTAEDEAQVPAPFRMPL